MSEVKGTRINRTERARQTRLRITRAAYELFIERGYPATTMTDVATAAEVAVQTVYFVFRTKAQLLHAAYDLAVIGEGEQIPPEQQPWYTQMTTAKRLPEALRLLVENVGTVLARTAPLDDYVRAASFDAEPAQIRAQHERMRRDAWTEMIDRLSERFPLRRGLSRGHAIDILLVLLGPATYQTLVTEYGWKPQDWSAWCISAISEQIFAPAVASAKRTRAVRR
jgi:AcrR family transcriptional regulator